MLAFVYLLLFLFILLSVGLSIGLWQTTRDNEDINQYLDLTQDEFLEVFNLPPVADPEEKLKRAETLKQHQQAVLEHNQAYLAGERTWYEGINEFSDIPDEEFIASHTGLIEEEEPEQVG